MNEVVTNGDNLLKSAFKFASRSVFLALTLFALGRTSSVNANQLSFSNYPFSNQIEGGLLELNRIDNSQKPARIAVLDGPVSSELLDQYNVDQRNSALVDGDGKNIPYSNYPNSHGDVIAGVLASYSNVPITSFQTCEVATSCSTEAIVKAIKDIAKNPGNIRVILMNIGGFEFISSKNFPQICSAIQLLPPSIIVIGSAGNNGLPILLPYSNGINQISIPTGCGLPNVIGVGAFGTDKDGFVPTNYSNYDANGTELPNLDVSGPGSAYYLTVDDKGEIVERHGSGTSVASPYIAALVAKILGEKPTLNTQEVLKLLLNGANCPNYTPADHNIGCRPNPKEIFKIHSSYIPAVIIK